MLWAAIGCLIAAVIIFNAMWIWQSKASKNPEKLEVFLRYKTAMQISYFLLLVAAAVLFIIW